MDILIDGDELGRIIKRMAYEVAEKAEDPSNIAIVGVQEGGRVPAERIAGILKEEFGRDISLGLIDITFYRDDLHKRKDPPKPKETKLPFSIDGREVFIVDDVIETGRTVRAAIDAILDYGRPKSIKLAVVVDKGNRELPIHPDIVGRRIEAPPGKEVVVLFREKEGEDKVVLRDKGASS